MEKDLKWIKKHYGEKMMHLCRTYLYQLLETDGLVPSLLEAHFYKSRNLADDIINEGQNVAFATYMNSFVKNKVKESVVKQKSAKELMDEAGYILFDECLTEDEIQAFRRFYDPEEVICTIKNGGRLKEARVWFAIKKNVADIKRENFKNPERQNEYGTSVISIQFSRGNDRLSIKNRYNHTITDLPPDNTFNSDLDNIIPGLSLAFERDYGVRDTKSAKPKFELHNYVNVGGKFYKYNLERDNIYYCGDNIVIDNFEVKKLPEHQMLVECYIFDFNENKVYSYDETKKDSFPESLGEIEKMSFNGKEIVVKVKNGKDVIIGIDKQRRIVSYKNENVTYVDSSFLDNNTHLQSLEMPNLEECENYFLYNNKELAELNLPLLKRCGDYLLYNNTELTELNLPLLKSCGDYFLYLNEGLTELHLPVVKTVGYDFLKRNQKLTELSLPSLVSCEGNFLAYNKELTEISLPALKTCGSCFMFYNTKIKKVSLPALKTCGSCFMFYNAKIKKVSLPAVESIDSYFLNFAEELRELNLQSLKNVDSSCLENSLKLEKVNIPKEAASKIHNGVIKKLLEESVKTDEDSEL